MILRQQGDDGFVGGFEGLLFGVLFFVIGTLLIGFAWGVVDTKAATGEAAQQAVRTFVEASDAPSAQESATAAADQALLGYGRDPARASVTLVSGQFARCSRVTISVSYPAPLLQLPGLGRLGQGEIISSTQSEIVDPFRTGLSGASSCP